MTLTRISMIALRALITLSVVGAANLSSMSANLYAAEPNVPETFRVSPNFGGPITRATQATGYGPNENDAVTDAIKNAVQQETGARISDDSGARGAVKTYRVISIAQVENLVAGIRTDESVNGSATDSLAIDSTSSANSSRSGFLSGDSDQSSTNDALNVERRSDVNMTLSSSSQIATYHWQATIEAEVYVFEGATDDIKPKLVVAPSEAISRAYKIGEASVSSGIVIDKIQNQIINILSQSGRFEILQRGASNEIQAEIDFINSGLARAQESSRLSQQFSADIILATKIDNFEYRKIVRSMRTTDREIVSYEGSARVSARLLNPTTGVLLTSQSFETDLPRVAETTMPPSIDTVKIVDDAIENLASEIAEHLIRKLFPISVISLKSSDVVLSQGGASLQAGAEYSAVILGEELTDPQTGSRLGRSESICCTIRISQVNDLTSTGQILGELSPNLLSFVPGMIELRDKIEQSIEPNASGNNREQSVQTQSMTVTAPISNQIRVSPPTQTTADPDW